jgi:hypothetical protein
LIHQVAELPFEFEDLGLQLGDASLGGTATRALRDLHTRTIAGSLLLSCASLGVVNGN